MQGTSSAAPRANKSENLQVWRNPWFEGMVFHRGVRFTHPYPRHWHDELHLCAYTAGAGYLRCRGETRLACAGDFILTPPSEVHSNWVPDGQTVSFVSLYIDYRDSTAQSVELRDAQTASPTCRACSATRND